MNYEKQMKQLERRKERARERAEKRHLLSLIEMNRGKPISVRIVTYSEEYEGRGYAGYELRTRTVEDYCVYAGTTIIKKCFSKSNAIEFINEHFAPAAQARSANKLRKAKKALGKAQAAVEAASEEEQALKVKVTFTLGRE
jgi:hypothetical protein